MGIQALALRALGRGSKYHCRGRPRTESWRFSQQCEEKTLIGGDSLNDNMSSSSLDTWVDQYVGQWLSQTTSSKPESNHPEIVSRKRKRTDRGENEMEDSVNRNSPPARPLIIPRLSTGASSAYDSPASITSATSKTSIKRKLEVLEYNSTPALAWHLIPTDLPNSVAKLLVHLTLAADGCESVPSSLKETIQSDPNLASEAFSRFVWSAPSVNTGSDPDIPSPAATRLWSFVQEILQKSRLLAFQKAEESEYYPLVQKILSLDLNQLVHQPCRDFCVQLTNPGILDLIWK